MLLLLLYSLTVLLFSQNRVFDESPHWLYSSKRYEEADVVMQKIASWNRNRRGLTVKLGEPQIKSEEKLEIEHELGHQSKNILVPQEKYNRRTGCIQAITNKRFMILFSICSFGW